MRKNKIVALIVTLVMVMQTLCCFTVFAQDATKTVLDTAEYDFFSALDMVPQADIFNVEDGMTRAQFAFVAARLSGWDGSNQGTSPFVDVADESQYKDAITFLYNTKIVQGTGASQFKPNDKITYIDATSIMIKILGYGTIAAAKYGEYPLSHIRMGDNLDLYDGIKTYGQSEALTSEDAFILLKNAAIASVAIPTAFGDTNEYSFDSKNTLLYVYHDIVKSEGVVTDDGYSAIDGATKLEPGAAIISGKKLSKSENGNTAKGLLGMYVDYYYVEDTNKFVYAEAQPNTSDVVTIKYDMLVPESSDFSLTNIVYYDANDKVKNAKISTTVDLVYNGGAYPGFATDDLKIESGFMVLIDRDTDKVYDAVNITEYQDVVVKGYDSANNVIYTEGVSINLDDYNQYIITDLDNREIKLENLVKDTVASVVAAKDNSSIHVISCAKNIVQGNVEYAETTEKKISVSGKIYEFANQFLENQKNGVTDSKDPEIGENYRFLLNADGKIVKAILLKSNAWYEGYCIGVGPDGTGLDTSAKMRTMTPQGGLLDLYFGNKVSINGEAGISPSKLLESPYLFKTKDGESYPIRQPLKYKIDSWGKITAIEVAVDNTTKEKQEIYKYGFDLDNFSKDVSLSSTEFKADLVQALNGMYFVTGDTLVISDPYLVNEQANAYKYEDVELISSLGHGQYDPADLYEVDEHYNVGMIVFKGSSTGGAMDFSKLFDERNQSLFVVDKVMRKLDEEGEKVKVITGVSYGAYVEYAELEEGIIPDDIEFGDICAYGITDNKLNGIHVLHKGAGDYMLKDDDGNYMTSKLVDGNRGASTILNSEWSTQYAPLYSVADKSFVLKFDPKVSIQNNGGSVIMNDLTLFSYSTNGGNVKVTIIDRKNGTVRPGTFADVYTNITPSANGEAEVDDSTPRVFVYRRFDYAREMVFIK